jgi:hypothetical protein
VERAAWAGEVVFGVEERGVGDGVGVKFGDGVKFGVDFVDAGYVGFGQGFGGEEVVVKALGQVG